MANQNFEDGQILTAAEMNTLAAQAGAALPSTIVALTALIATLPTTLPGSSGQLWLNGGVIQVS